MTVLDMVWLVAKYLLLATIAATCITIWATAAYNHGWGDRIAGRPLGETDPDDFAEYIEREASR